MDIIRQAIRDVPDFPKPGILFKDITPLLQDPQMGKLIVKNFIEQMKGTPADAILGVESRGFLFGYMLAVEMGIPFIPIRKSGKLPWKTIGVEYALEYGTAKVEMHEDALKSGMKIMIHDDLLATGGTAVAAAKLANMQGATVSAFTFVVELGFLNGRELLKGYSDKIISLVEY